MNGFQPKEGSPICGIVFIAGKVHYKEEQVFKEMLMLDTRRGWHSTGIAAIKNDGTISYAKEVGTPWTLFETQASKDIFRGTHTCLIGHNRMATKGEVTKNNAHPFHFDNVIGVHNGTLRSVLNLDDHKDFEVDSENLYHHMSNHGDKETIKILNGAFALAYYNVKTHQLRLVRNSERPLFFAFTEDNETVLGASEPWMIHLAAQMHDLKIHKPKEVSVKNLHIFPLKGKEFKQFTYHNNWEVEPVDFFTQSTTHRSGTTTGTGGGHTSNVSPFRKSVEKGNKQSQYQVVNSYRDKTVEFAVDKYIDSSKGHGSYIRAYTDDYHNVEIRIYCNLSSPLYDKLMRSVNYFEGKVKNINWHGPLAFLQLEARTIAELEVAVELDKVITKDEDKKPTMGNIVAYGYNKEPLTMAEWLSSTNVGCCVCTKIPKYQDHSELEWINDEDFICPVCKETNKDATEQMRLMYTATTGGK